MNILANNPYFFPNRENPKLLFLPHFSQRFLYARLRGHATEAQYDVGIKEMARSAKIWGFLEQKSLIIAPKLAKNAIK